MVDITLAKALQLKKRVAQRMTEAFDDVIEHNRIISGNVRPIDIDVRKAEAVKLRGNLVLLKWSIQDASRPISLDILLLSELKSTITYLKRIQTGEGKVPRGYLEGGLDLTYESHFKKAAIDAEIIATEKEIDSIQEKIDAFNASTRVVLDFEI